MPAIGKPADADVDQVKARLSQGLESCRTMVDDYRTTLSNQCSPTGAQANFGDYGDETGEARTSRR